MGVDTAQIMIILAAMEWRVIPKLTSKQQQRQQQLGEATNMDIILSTRSTLQIVLPRYFQKMSFGQVGLIQLGASSCEAQSVDHHTEFVDAMCALFPLWKMLHVINVSWNVRNT